MPLEFSFAIMSLLAGEYLPAHKADLKSGLGSELVLGSELGLGSELVLGSEKPHRSRIFKTFKIFKIGSEKPHRSTACALTPYGL